MAIHHLVSLKMIRRCFDDIKDCDWLLFLDADMRVVDTVNPEELFDDTKKYIGVHHPCHYLNFLHTILFLERLMSPLSRACVAEDDDLSVYVQGCLWGGKMPCHGDD